MTAGKKIESLVIRAKLEALIREAVEKSGFGACVVEYELTLRVRPNAPTELVRRSRYD